MKRPRSYGEDIDNGISDKALYKEWGRRDQDPDRLLSHRRFYPKAENGRKGSSSSNDRSLDDDRELLRPPRKRFEHDSDGFDRRKGFDRYRDCSDRAAPISSPRSIYNGDRIHRSESFPAPPRREFPKGFRSDRDRPRREESVSAWRRSITNGKDADEDRVDLGRGSRVGSEDRGSVRSSSGSRDLGKSPTWSKDSGGEQSKSIELKKTEEANRDSGNSSEMEEGELEPDPDPISEPDPDPISKPESEPEPEVEPLMVIEPPKSLNGLETDTTKEAKSSHEEKLQIDDMSICNGKQEGDALEIVRDMVEKTDKGSDCQDNAVNELCGSEEEVKANMGGEKEENVEEEEHMHLPSPNPEFQAKGKEELNEETSKDEVKEHKGVENERKPSPLEAQKEEKGIDLETEAEDVDLLNSNKAVEEDNVPDVTLRFVADNLNGNAKDKGKSLAVSPSNEGNSTENGGWMDRDLLTGRDDAMEGPSSRGFELFFHSDVTRPEKTNQSGVDEFKAEKLKMEPLELALGLPNVSLSLASHDPKQSPSSLGQAPNSPSRGRSVHSLPTTLRTSSDGFTASISFSGSHPFVHNPSCSLTQNSFENYEHSVGSHPIFQGVDQIPQGSCQGQSSNEPKRKEVPLYQRMLQNGNGTPHPSHASQGTVNRQAVQGQGLLKVSEGSTGMPNGLDRQLSLSRQFSGQLRHDEVRSPSHSVGSRETRPEHNMDKKQVMRERNGGGIFRPGQRELEQLVLSGISVSEMIIAKMVSENIQIMARRIQEMTEQSIAYLKESVCEMIGNEDKQGQLRALQEALQRRSDFTLDTLKTCHRAQLEILVALKTGLLDFLRSANNVPTSDLVEIFLNMKCRNLACRSSLPVDECDCKVCAQKNGFCSVCMCMVCSKFDMASNTCSWVGCDDCLHWCHTDCALRDLHIRNGRSVSGVQGTTEIQFHCVACGQPSEMFGFVKEVFKTCAKDWKVDNLSKELEYVRRIFCSSDDGRGKRLHDVAARLLGMLENKSNLSEVYKLIMQFLTESDSKLSTTPALVKELSQKNPREGSNGMVGPSQEAMWLRSVSTEKAPRVENANCVLPSMDWDRVGRQTSVPESQLNVDKKPVLDELESIVRIKQAEANMFQTRADDARREAEALKRIAIAKNKKIEEEYASRITKLRLSEAEERRRQKLEELQVLERAHCEYFNMKMRMEGDIKDLLLKMEATKRNLSM
ncbi:protein OBERON 4-like [Magnolia sinica]|uniref:protein OBERON 4-like n=1 Tax=Magnolia sinica TaxID=86752 RepID=UPI00265ACA7D|nr:protein OBERON 4-like [Magnolia sinica]